MGEIEKTNFLNENTDLEEDIDISCDHSYEADRIVANTFLSRGLSESPRPNGDNKEIFKNSCCKFSTYDWLSDIKCPIKKRFPIAEVQFKNSHKEFFLLPENETFETGDIVVVESATSFDIGIICLMGDAVQIQMKSKNAKEVTKKIHRRAKASDIEKWINVVNKEYDTMMRSRYTAWDINLDMKINDVEFQGDGSKAIFYYSSDERVDFRELIKILADTFHIRIEMRQIGVRQEAARLGGLGCCGREICCASWLNNFQTVSTSAARTQQLSLNPQKLAGQCGKLKCCLNFENEAYQEELKKFPDKHAILKTEKGDASCHKIDIFKKLMWYTYKQDTTHMLYAIHIDKVKEILEENQNNRKVSSLEDYAEINQGSNEETNYSMDDLKSVKD